MLIIILGLFASKKSCTYVVSGADAGPVPPYVSEHGLVEVPSPVMKVNHIYKKQLQTMS